MGVPYQFFNTYSVRDHRSGAKHTYNTSGPITSGHGGGDESLIWSFIKSLRSDDVDRSTDEAQSALTSYMLSFAAEEARVTRTIVDINEYQQSYNH